MKRANLAYVRCTSVPFHAGIGAIRINWEGSIRKPPISGFASPVLERLA